LTKKDYQETVEKEFNRPLKDIMYEICVEKNLTPIQGAEIIKVPKDVFIYWRSKYRFGQLQILCDRSRQSNSKKIENYTKQLLTTDLTRPFNHLNTNSISGFKEIIERYIELLKAKKILYSKNALDTFSLDIEIANIEQMLIYVDSYYSGTLYKKFQTEVDYIKTDLANEGILDQTKA
jgi:hypothetical protein